jgi:hypothetical protein
MKKKGQGLSLTTIIVAAVGLIVLVVLVAIFTGRMGVWLGGISKAAQEELAAMQIRYGKCRPSRGMENTFMKALDAAETDSDENLAINDFEQAISSCGTQGSEAECTRHSPAAYTGLSCAWAG